MSNSGVGRGRGWLNLSKNSTTAPCPVGVPIPNDVPSVNDSQFEDVPSQYIELINKVKQLNVNDDGIKFNQKIKYILEHWTENCKTADDVEKSFDALYQASLSDSSLASKLVIMTSSRSFISQKILDQNIRYMFLHKLQNNFEGGKNLQKINPIAFNNTVRMLGEFYNKARLASGQQFKFMAAPFISCLEMLLESGQPQDIKLFTTQLYLNGLSVKAGCLDKFAGVLNGIRLMLSSEKKLSKESKLWLLLALEMANNNFENLPGDIYKFYQEQLGEAVMESFQRSPGALSIQTIQENSTLDNYQSKVNVLQVSTSSDSSIDQLSTQPQNLQSDHGNASQTLNSNLTSYSTSQNSSAGHRDSSNGLGKHGRPILGVGARFNKNKCNDDSTSNGSTEPSNKGNNKQRNTGNWRESKKLTKPNKGWQHDDRFETS